MFPDSKGPAAWITALLLTLFSALAEADVAAGVAAYQQSDFVTAFREFQEPARRDDVHALNYLGIMYAEGLGAPRDDRQAVAMFSKAALLGFPEAMANLARMHVAGRGVPQDNKAAIAAYRAAARAGFQPAIVRMAEIYENGELGEAPDPAVAREWRARLQGQQQQTVAAVPPEVSAPAQNPPDAVAVSQQSGQTQNPPAQPADPAAPEVPDHAQNAIEAVAVTLQSGQILIKVRTKAPLAAPPVGFVVATPPRIAFDFPHTVTSLGRYHEVGEGDLRSVDVIQSGSRTRMVLILRSRMQHHAKVDGRDLLITLTPVK